MRERFVDTMRLEASDPVDAELEDLSAAEVAHSGGSDDIELF